MTSSDDHTGTQRADDEERATTAVNPGTHPEHVINTSRSNIAGRETSPDRHRGALSSAGSDHAGDLHPNNTRLRTASSLGSPSALSPTSSLIFERNVQEPVSPHEPTPAIPAHIKTEDLIPPALEASSLAITNARLDPDDVQIVTLAAHQPTASKNADLTASATLSEPRSPVSVSRRPSNVPSDTGVPANDGEEGGLNYGSLDPNDVRRLSFISFADVVQGEQAEPSGPLPASPGAQSPASGKPCLSPVQSGPMSSSHSTLQSSDSKCLASSGGQQQQGDLAIETIRQALNKSTSKDMAGITSPVSPTRISRSP